MDFRVISLVVQDASESRVRETLLDLGRNASFYSEIEEREEE